jgi:hypothetical protein
VPGDPKVTGQWGESAPDARSGSPRVRRFDRTEGPGRLPITRPVPAPNTSEEPWDRPGRGGLVGYADRGMSKEPSNRPGSVSRRWSEWGRSRSGSIRRMPRPRWNWPTTWTGVPVRSTRSPINPGRFPCVTERDRDSLSGRPLQILHQRTPLGLPARLQGLRPTRFGYCRVYESQRLPDR